MKKIFWISALAIMIGASAYAVSIDFAVFQAVKIGELTTTSGEDYTETRIDFEGPGLQPFMVLLPQVSDMESGEVLPFKRMLSISNAGQEGVEENKATAIFIECDNKERRDSPACNITIIKGVIPG